jgi:ADP-ribose pyrophosphatase YjhB (NUDIX family)
VAAMEINYKYCPECGAKMAIRIGSEDPPRPACTQCGLIVHPDPKVAAAGLICREDSVLLVKRARPPQKDFWCLPGGFVDRGETLETAAVREVLEETGLIVEVDRLFGLYSYPGYPVVVAIFDMTVTGGKIKLNNESVDIQWFKHTEILWDRLAFPSAVDALRTWSRVFKTTPETSGQIT